MTILGSNPRARVNTSHPEAFGICDRCGFVRNLDDLVWQQEWRGNQLMRTGFRVCPDTCLDVPFQLDRPIFLPPDPPPVPNPRPNFWAQQTSGSGPSAAPPQHLVAEDGEG